VISFSSLKTQDQRSINPSITRLPTWLTISRTLDNVR